MDHFLLYFILRLDAISSTYIALATATGVLFIIALGTSVLHEDEDICNRAKPWLKRTGIPFVIILFLAVMAPDTKQAAVIYCLPKIINNEQVQKLPDNLLRLANSWIDGKIAETTETVTEVAETVTTVVETVVEPIKN